MKLNRHELQLDKDFSATDYSQIKYDYFVFSGGEEHIKIQTGHLRDSNSKVVVSCRPKNSSDVMKILIAKDALNKMGFARIELFMPYLPYARQDRICNTGEAFSLKVFCNLINSAKFDKVIIMDCHSDVGVALLNNVENRNNHDFVKESLGWLMPLNRFTELALVSPDAGSNKKCQKLIETSDDFECLVKCDKTRDISTGELTGFEVYSSDLEGRDCLIVDDICDGGGTFLGLASELKKKNAGDLYLCTTHGIFSKGLDVLDVFREIYCTNSFKNIQHKNVKQIKIQY